MSKSYDAIFKNRHNWGMYTDPDSGQNMHRLRFPRNNELGLKEQMQEIQDFLLKKEKIVASYALEPGFTPKNITSPFLRKEKGHKVITLNVTEDYYKTIQEKETESMLMEFENDQKELDIIISNFISIGVVEAGNAIESNHFAGKIVKNSPEKENQLDEAFVVL